MPLGRYGCIGDDCPSGKKVANLQDFQEPD